MGEIDGTCGPTDTPRDGSKVYERLRAAILRLDMRPGSVIEEAKLADTLQVSRTPIREALIQLIADGLVVRDGRTARVAPLEFDDVPRIFDALLVASRLVHRLAAEHRTDGHLTRIRRAMLAFEQTVAAGDGLARSEANFAFHSEIAGAAQNAYIQQFYGSTARAQLRLARACFSGDELDGADPGDGDTAAHMAETARQHRLLFEAIAGREVVEADRLATLHEDLSRSRLRSKLFAQGRAPALALEAT